MGLSVVIPAKNVENWIADALESVLAQEVEDLEVIVVDNGSTDRSPDIVREYAARDHRLQLLSHPAGGTGGARNAGIEHVRGEFLTFVDPDDVVLPGAWSAMLSSLRTSGSDFAVGHFERLHPDGSRSDLPWARRVHGVAQAAVSLEQWPEIVGDVFVWNKVFRSSFWREHSLRFPENTRYQDQPVVTEAFLRSRTFDVLPQTVYLWRVREDQSSVTQRRDDLSNLSDRVTTKSDTWALVERLGTPAVVDLFRRRIMAGDLHHYFAAIPGCTDDYWHLLRSMVVDLWGEHFADTEVLPVQRLIGWLVSQNRRSDATSVAAYVGSNQPPLPVCATSDRQGLALVTDSVVSDPVPEQVRRLSPWEWGWRVEARTHGWRRVSGTVYLDRLGASAPFDEVAGVEQITVTVPTSCGSTTLTGPLATSGASKTSRPWRNR